MEDWQFVRKSGVFFCRFLHPTLLLFVILLSGLLALHQHNEVHSVFRVLLCNGCEVVIVFAEVIVEPAVEALRTSELSAPLHNLLFLGGEVEGLGVVGVFHCDDVF